MKNSEKSASPAKPAANPRLANLKNFPKGKSGNPNGRPKGTPNASTVIKKWLSANEKVVNPLTKKSELLSQMDLITLGQVAKARKGDTAAFNALLDRLYGKPKQTVDMDHTTEGESLNQPASDLSALSDAELRTLVKLQKKIKS